MDSWFLKTILPGLSTEGLEAITIQEQDKHPEPRCGFHTPIPKEARLSWRNEGFQLWGKDYKVTWDILHSVIPKSKKASQG